MNRERRRKEKKECHTSWLIRRLRMINHIMLRPIWTHSEARMPRAIDSSVGVLLEHTAIAMFAPATGEHGVITDKLEQTETVEWGVDAGGRVHDEVLAGVGVHQLLGTLVAGEAHGSPAGHLLPGLVGDGDDSAVAEGGVDRQRVGHARDAQVGGPRAVGVLPATVDVIELVCMVEVGAVNGELVEGVEGAL